MQFILWRGRPHTEALVAVESLGLRSWKRDLLVEAAWTEDWIGVTVSYQEYYRYERAVDPSKWEHLSGPWSFGFNLRHWRLGYNCGYYDGTHNTLSLGPIHLYWYGHNRCNCED